MVFQFDMNKTSLQGQNVNLFFSVIQFPKVLREDISVTIIQSRDHILNTFDSSISAYAEKKFERENLNVVVNARVERINENTVAYNIKNNADPKNPTRHEIPYGFCLWSTGICE